MFTRALMKTLLLAAMSLVSTAAGGVSAQTTSDTKPGCKVINVEQAGQFISYEKVAWKEVVLRLHNNTDCTIVVETDDKELIGFKRLPNGNRVFVALTGPQDGVHLPLHYLLQDRKQWKLPVPAKGWGDSVFHYEIFPRQSIIFSVPLSHFRKGMDVLVPFKFEWEGNRETINMTSGRVAHRIYFLAEQLPKISSLR